MKSPAISVFHSCFGAALLLAGQASAALLYWDGAGNNDNWSNNNNWSTSSSSNAPGNDPTQSPTGTDSAIFNITSLNAPVAPKLVNDHAALGLVFNNTGSTNITAPSPKLLTLGVEGIFMSSTSGAVTISADLAESAPQSWTNNSSALLTISSPTVSKGGFLLTSNGTGDTTISSIISGAGGLTKSDAGILTLTGTSTSTYSGSTIVKGGTLALGASDVLPTTPMVLNGGRLSTTGGNTETTGTLELISASTIVRGTGLLAFADSSSISWNGILSIWNWTTGTIKFGTTPTGLTSGTGGQLSKIVAYSGAGMGTITQVTLDSNGFLVAVPEPGAVMAGILLLGGIGWRERRHFLRRRTLA